MTNTKPKKQTLKSFVRTLSAKLSNQEVFEKAKPLFPATTINSIISTRKAIRLAQAKSEPATAKPKLAHFKAAKPTTAVVASSAFTAEESQLRLIVAKIGTLRARAILDEIERTFAS